MKPHQKSLPKFGLLSTALLLVVPQIAFSHGEDKFGPHGGFVRMPGAYHTEVVINKKQPSELSVYLLDIQFKNPTVKDSSVELSYRPSGEKPKDVKVACEAKSDRFICTLPKGVNLNQGEITLNTTREKAKGNAAVYPLPLKLIKLNAPSSGHSHHGHSHGDAHKGH